MTARWYVVHVYSGFENKVAQSIREQTIQKGMDNLIVSVEVPSEEVVHMRRGAKVSSERKFFPGYVLAKMEMTDESWHLVKNRNAIEEYNKEHIENTIFLIWIKILIKIKIYHMVIFYQH